MSDSSSSSNETKILGVTASLLGLIGIILYYTGWTYRWSYFGYFSISINDIDFSYQSFLFLPIQVFVGSWGALGRTIIAFIFLAIIIKITLWLLQNSTSWQNSSYAGWRQKFHQWKPLKILRTLASVIPSSLRKELVVVFWLLVTLFWLARLQGQIDARRDAIHNTSTLPVITLVVPEKKMALGRNLEDIFTNPSLKGYRIIGDKGLFEALRGIETNDANSEKPRVWRLLLETKKSSYLFPGLAVNAEEDERPPILVIREDKEGQLMILSPDYTQKKN